MKIVRITALVLLLGLLAGCGKEAPAEPTTEPVTAAATTEPTEYIPSILEQAQQDGVAVETPYITLYYPNRWSELQSAEVTQSGENYRMTFRTTVAEQTVELFSLVIGPDTQEGYLLGTLDGKNVYSIMNEQNPEDWSEADYGDLCRQQEYINELILQLYEHPEFTPA